MLEIKISTWQYNALCRQHSSNLFFPPATFEKKEDREKRESKAKGFFREVLWVFRCKDFHLFLKRYNFVFPYMIYLILN